MTDGPHLGNTMPRLFTPPLVTGPPGPCGCGCALDYDSSYGFYVADFAEYVLNAPLDPWQRWLAIHMGELLTEDYEYKGDIIPAGTVRFREVLVMVARQQGKTHLLKVLSLYWLFVEQQRYILGTSVDRDAAKDAWQEACDLAFDSPLADDIPPGGYRSANGQEELKTVHGSRYKIAATNRKGGRGRTVFRLILDELREHRTWVAYNASFNATNAVPTAQIVAITNQGDDESVILDAIREPAVLFIEKGVGNSRAGLFEWSADLSLPKNSPEALKQANPNAGRRSPFGVLQAQADRAVAAGGEELASFQTEVLCQRVRVLRPAIDPVEWPQCVDLDDRGQIIGRDLAPYRRQVALCLETSMDGTHSALVAAVVLDGLVYAEVVHQWDGKGHSAALRRELPAIVRRVAPGRLGWFPKGPAAGLAADMKSDRRNQWPPRGTKIVPIEAETRAVCMGLANLVDAHEIRHPGDPMLNLHVASAQKQDSGDGFIFARIGTAPISGAYALAGAVHLARTMPPAPRRMTDSRG